MMRTSLMDLSTDIKTLIINHVIRPTDMVSLCLTCKQFHEITVRQLYQTVTLDVGGHFDTRLGALLSPRNIGLKHVRNVELYLADVMDKCNQMQQATFAIRMMLELLPENTLEKFSWHPWSPFSADNLAILYTRQKKMKWLEAITLDQPFCQCLQKTLNFDSIMENTTKLGLYPDSRDVLNFCHEILVRTKKVDKITLHANFDENDPPIPIRDLNESATEAGILTRTIFAHMKPEDRFKNCKPYVLQELTLQKISLRYASKSYCRIIDFSQLKNLRVFGCTGADALFAELCKSSRLPDRLDTLEFKLDDDRDGEALNALDSFLCLVTGVQRLTVDIGYAKNMPTAAGISRHSRTLKSLNVHASPGDCDDEELVFENAEFLDICVKCTLLEQISLAFPPTSITRAPSEEFAAFTSALSSLSNLVTVNMTTWPTSAPSSHRLPRRVYEHLLQGMAQDGFVASAANALSRDPPISSKLSVIAWGTSDKIYEREESKHCIIFVKGKQMDPFGKESPLAVQVGWCLRKYAVPQYKTEVLDFALARSVRPPTRDPPLSDDSE